MTFGLKNRHSMACIVQTKRLRYKLNKWKDGGRQALPQAVKVLLKSQLTSSQTVEISFPFPSLCGRPKKGRGSGGGRKVPFPRPMSPCAFTLWPTDGCLNFHLFIRQFVLKLFLFAFFRPFVSPPCWKECLSLCGRSGCDVLFAFTSYLFLTGPKWIFHLVCFDKRGKWHKGLTQILDRVPKTENSVACKLNLCIFRQYCKLCQIFFNVVLADRRRWSTH